MFKAFFIHLACAVTALANAGLTQRPDIRTAEMSCDLRRPDGSSAPISVGEVRSLCPGNSLILACDANGMEPVDIPVPAVCRTSMRHIEGTPVKVAVPSPRDVTVEWLEPSGEGVRVVASRKFKASTELVLRVAQTRNRIMRFMRSGSSPVSVGGRIVPGEVLNLAEPQPGGELLALIEPARVLPKSYRIQGPMQREVARAEAAFISVPGLIPGDYEIHGRYDLGIEGTKTPFRVAAGESTVAFLKPDPVGRANIRAIEGACFAGSELQLVRTVPESSFGFRQILPLVPFAESCHWILTGLKAGHYTATLRDARGTQGRESFDIQPQTESAINIDAAKVAVTGSVQYNGAFPDAVNTRLQFRRIRTRSNVVEVSLDSTGGFSADLPEPGEYELRLLRNGSPLPQVRRLTIENGPNEVHWEIQAGALKVVVKGWDRKAPVTVTVSGVSAMARELRPDDDNLVEFTGLLPGSYIVRARSGQNHASRTSAPATVAANSLVPTVEINLVDGSSLLRVLGPDGTSLPNARVLYPRQLPQLEPGVFSIEGVGDGIEIRVTAPGYAPSCRRWNVGKDIEIRLQPGRPISVEFVPPLAGPFGFVDGLLGSDCAIALSAFDTSGLNTETGQRIYRVQNFPPQGAFTWTFERERRSVVVDPSGKAVVDRRKP